MKEIDILKDLIQYKISSETFYNESIIKVRNPEARQLFMQLRDDEMRDIFKLQQKIEKIQSKPAIYERIFPVKSKY